MIEKKYEEMEEKEVIDERLKVTLKKVKVPYKGQTAIVKMTIDNKKVI